MRHSRQLDTWPVIAAAIGVSETTAKKLADEGVISVNKLGPGSHARVRVEHAQLMAEFAAYMRPRPRAKRRSAAA
jgi:hypothetical protein